MRWPAGNRADTALDGLRKAEAKAVCAPPSPAALRNVGARAGAGAGSGTQGAKPFEEFSPCPHSVFRVELEHAKHKDRGLLYNVL